MTWNMGDRCTKKKDHLAVVLKFLEVYGSPSYGSLKVHRGSPKERRRMVTLCGGPTAQSTPKS